MANKYLMIFCLLLYILPLTKGMSAPHQGQRCLCHKSSKSLNVKETTKIEIFPKSTSCERIEVIATIKDKSNTVQAKCINPKAKLVKEIISGKIRKMKGMRVINHLKA
ncbi:C-X-C motif chemokine 10-like [Spea bombifrons]|uniref:C-X-C motif chemokine 10-like n=1 Tax=Spea bombifrons TaxID=233779 RepID=UPI00234B63B6|nr:C-X-C motif chemokine 10-like [Spea bombifrons]